jgi:hypothetical protein
VSKDRTAFIVSSMFMNPLRFAAASG